MKRVIRFTANWCAPCKTYEPIFNEVVNTSPNTVPLVVDVDKNPTLAKKYNVKSVPATALEVNGEFRGLRAGVMTREELKTFIDS